jgi:hypothetical protein
MLKRFALALAVFAVLLAAGSSLAQMANERGEAKVTLAGKLVTIDYGRPSLKGRDMLAQAQVGQAWRMGSGAATTLKTEADLMFGTASVPKGEYVLKATKLAADTWQLDVVAKSDAAPRIAAAPFTTETLPESVEQFTIDLTGEGNKGELRLRWGKTALKATFSVK